MSPRRSHLPLPSAPLIYAIGILFTLMTAAQAGESGNYRPAVVDRLLSVQEAAERDPDAWSPDDLSRHSSFALIHYRAGKWKQRFVVPVPAGADIHPGDRVFVDPTHPQKDLIPSREHQEE